MLETAYSVAVWSAGKALALNSSQNLDQARLVGPRLWNDAGRSSDTQLNC